MTLDDGNLFYLAGVWESLLGGWPLPLRTIKVAANP